MWREGVYLKCTIQSNSLENTTPDPSEHRKDPDAPSRENPKFGEWHHWLITNIPGNSVSQGDVMSEYVGAGPPKDTGLHRYVFLLFKQSGGKQTFEGLHKLTNRSGNNRKSWKVRDFAKKYNLQLLAGNFFQAQFDDYVPKLHQQLSGK
ncbi:protein D2 isoform X2 [Lingula anatina]|uniref:Protein D2 isoform X2 n=1 Tax=Lingula anatina TaxID=7574 RepID=A0A1S3IY51_LINAN|nr:protein D2 isoform X2 [Lingula anatina]|eukprot:XP_013403127.1 protein D2 isoform X2 [Lingula anatina]